MPADRGVVRGREAVQLAALRSELASERARSRRLEAQLRNLADHDPITDLVNRRSLEHELEDHLAACTRYGPEGAFLLVDLDGLDEIARSIGPGEADELLAQLAEQVADRLRGTDVAGRWATDQLAVLLPRAADAEVVAVADALLRLVAEAATARVPAGSLGASIGVAVIPTPPVDLVRLVAGAARAASAACSRGGGTWVRADLEASVPGGPAAGSG